MSTNKEGYIELEDVNGEENHIRYGSNCLSGSLQNQNRTSTPNSRTIEGIEDHCHNNACVGMDSSRRKAARKKLIYASIVCILFIAVEVVGGILAGSLAILTDAAHLLSDFSSFLISYFALVLADKRPSKHLTWGWHRAEVLGALLSVMMIWAITAVLVVLAILKIAQNTYTIDAKIMMITAGVAIFANVVMLVVLHNPCSGHGHSHGGHGHLHGGHKASDKHNLVDDQNKDEQTKDHSTNVNVRAAILHVIGDFFQSLAVFIAAVIIYVKPEYKVADPICTFIFSILVLGTTITITKDIVNVLMEAKPDGIDFPDVSNSIRGLKGIKSLHDLRIWMLTTEVVACSVHVTIDNVDGVNQQSLLNDIRNLMRKKYGIIDCTVQVEEHTFSMDTCNQCVLPGENMLS